MSPIQNVKCRAGAAAVALAAAVAAAAVLASPAAAASAGGEAFLRPANHDRGRTLSGQGVKILAGAGAGTAGAMLTMPLTSLEASGAATPASLTFKRGKRSLALTGIGFDLAKGTLNGSLGGEQLAVFHLGGAADLGAGAASLQGGKLSLTRPAAAALERKLGLQRALVRRAVGMVWLAARAEQPRPLTPAPKPTEPVRPAARPVASGSIEWGFLSSWRSYVLVVPPAGSTEVSAGATATGPLVSPATTFAFPATGGSYTAAAGSSPEQLTLTSKGSVKWAKPAHNIFEFRLSDLEIEIGPSGSWLIADVSTNLGVPTVTDDVRFASLGAASPTVAGDSVTWTAVPTTLTAAGASSFSGFYEAGKELEPVTFTAALG